MGFLRMIRDGWKAMSTADKIGTCIDIVCGIGASAAGTKIGSELSKGSGKLESFCIRTASLGACLAAGEVGSNYLSRNYGNLAGAVIDKKRGKDVKVDMVNTNRGPAITWIYGEEKAHG